MPVFNQILARSSWRVRVVFDTLPFGATTPATYTIVRADGVHTDVAVTRAWTIDGNAVELSLGTGLLDRFVYTLTATGVTGSATFSHLPPLPQAIGAVPNDDPEAELFGVDLDWIAPSLSPAGDIPEVRGVECLKHDLAAIANTKRGELFHRPDAGADIRRHVNGPTQLGEIVAAVRREWERDDRVKKLSLVASENTLGETVIRGDIVPVAVDDKVPIAARIRS